MAKQKIGLIGLAVMGQNLVLNIERNGFPVAVYNRTGSKTEEFIKKQCQGKKIVGTYSFEEFCASLEKPRRIILMVKAGEAVDGMIASLKPYLEKGDIIIDGGNSFFKDTERRAMELEKEGFCYIGTGVSGGEYGALNGPSIMPGGQPEAYKQLEKIFAKIAAQVDDGPCVTYIGPRGAGHFVKMCHNGIEYGDMQLICEAYDILHRALNLEAAELHKIFSEWNQGELSSYLIEITADIFKVNDPKTGKPLVELILDTAGQKGTGKWTSQVALDIGSAIPTINAAVEARIISSYKKERTAAAKFLSGPKAKYTGDKKKLIESVRQALYASKICSYAQGMAMMKTASDEFGYNLNLGEIARIWKGGCIIRAQFLDKIKEAFQRDPKLPNLLMDKEFGEAVQSRQQALRFVVTTAVELGISTLAMNASLAYYDAYRSERLPANMIQAQRDYFGAHTYQMIDREGTFHTEWQS